MQARFSLRFLHFPPWHCPDFSSVSALADKGKEPALHPLLSQLVPQSAHRNFRRQSAGEYNYRGGDFLPGSGHLRIRVAPDGVTVAFVRAATQEMERQGIRNGDVAFTYAIAAR